ncbi:uncharacterized protein At4g18257-like [Trifolium pratense]|uniref:Uncharacterized protein n=1 Tax=Trifolium pratense TaxID=57577 RepID=A0ACB0MAL6_TRIPR|nr:uncharacterized protein At4g18257-like [Trifolium pratense]CAJ2677907.1 unnamed protein product [Trifolium pratense]
MTGTEEPTAKKRIATESLGWLTESSIMPKKHRAIEGVGASSILELKAELYKSQEDSKKSRELSGPDAEYQRAKTIITSKDPYSNKNSGVEARAHKDKLELKAIKDGTVNYAALEKKAVLYDKLVRGELSDEEDKEKYCVDFARKGDDHDDVSATPNVLQENERGGVDGDGDGDAFSMFNLKRAGIGQSAGVVDGDEHKRNVREVHEEANRAREKASEIKLRRQEQLAAHREKLKQAYLRKRLEQLKATSVGSGSGSEIKHP